MLNKLTTGSDSNNVVEVVASWSVRFSKKISYDVLVIRPTINFHGEQSKFRRWSSLSLVESSTYKSINYISVQHYINFSNRANNITSSYRKKELLIENEYKIE